jgi:predicted MFS family arabinose efflux permease
LSLGGIGAFLVGGAFAQTFLKKYYLSCIGILMLALTLYGYIFSYTDEWIFAIMMTMIGFLYGLWNVMKSVLVSIEIKKTGLPETAVTAIVGMMFVMCIIIGSLLGSSIYEGFGHN